MDNKLAELIEKQNISELEQVINADNIDEKCVIEPESRFNIEYSPVDYAIEKQAYESLFSLFGKGADFSHLIDKEGKLERHIIYDAKVMQFLFDKGVNLNTIVYYSYKDEYENVLSKVCRYGDNELLKTLLGFGYEFEDDEQNPFWQVLGGTTPDPEKVRTLIRKGYDYKEEGNELILAIVVSEIDDAKKPAFLQIMVEEQCYLEIEKQYLYWLKKDTLIGHAISEKQGKTIAKLIELGADISTYQTQVATLLDQEAREELKEEFAISDDDLCSSFNNKETQEYIDSKDSFKASNALGYILTNKNLVNPIKFAEQVIAKGGDVNKPFSYTLSGGEIIQCSPLYALCWRDKNSPVDGIELLLKSGAEDIVEGKSALFHCVAEVKVAFLKCLLENGINPNGCIMGKPLTAEAIGRGLEPGEVVRMNDEIWVTYLYKGKRDPMRMLQKVGILDTLLKYGLDLNYPTPDDRSALDLAIYYRDDEYASKLIHNYNAEVTNETVNCAFANLTTIDLLGEIVAKTKKQNIELSGRTIHDFLYNTWPEDKAENKAAACELLLDYVADKKLVYDGETFLQMAISAGNKEAITILLNNKDEIDISPDTILWAIHYHDDVKVIGDLVEMFPDYEEPNFFKTIKETKSDSATPIAIAIHKQRWTLAHYLLDRFPTMRASNNAVSYIGTAVFDMEELDTLLIKKLVDRDTDINRRYYECDDTEKWTGLNLLCYYYSKNKKQQNKYYKAIEIFVKKGASMDDLHLHDLRGEERNMPDLTNLFSIMLDHAQDFNYVKPVYDLLIENGAEPQKQVGSFKESSLVGVIQRQGAGISEEATLQYVKYIWGKTGFDPHETMILGNNLATSAAMIGKPEVLKFLASLGADIHHVGGFDNSNPIHKCISNYSFVDSTARTKTVETLLDLGVDVEVPDPDPGVESYTPLMNACRFGIQQTIELLIARGADVNYVTPEGYTPLIAAITGNRHYNVHHSIEGAKDQLVKYLISKGANPNTVAGNHYFPLIEAVRAGRPAIFRTLLKSGADPYLVDPDLKEESSNMGFIKEKRPDENGINTTGFIILKSIDQYIDILEEFLGSDAIAQARADLDNNIPPQDPSDRSLENKKLATKSKVNLTKDGVQTIGKMAEAFLDGDISQDRSNSSKDLSKSQSIANVDGVKSIEIGEEGEESAETIEQPTVDLDEKIELARIFSTKTEEHHLELSIKAKRAGVAELAKIIETQYPSFDMQNGHNWMTLIEAIIKHDNEELAGELKFKATVEKAIICLPFDNKEVAQGFQAVIADNLATVAALFKVIEEVKDGLEWQEAGQVPAPKGPKTFDVFLAELSADIDPAERIEIAEVFKTMVHFGLKTYLFQLESETMRELGSAINAVSLHADMSDGNHWAYFIKALVSKKAPQIVDKIDFDSSNISFCMVVECASDEDKKIIEELEKILAELLSSKNHFMRFFMSVKSSINFTGEDDEPRSESDDWDVDENEFFEQAEKIYEKYEAEIEGDLAGTKECLKQIDAFIKEASGDDKAEVIEVRSRIYYDVVEYHPDLDKEFTLECYQLLAADALTYSKEDRIQERLSKISEILDIADFENMEDDASNDEIHTSENRNIAVEIENAIAEISESASEMVERVAIGFAGEGKIAAVMVQITEIILDDQIINTMNIEVETPEPTRESIQDIATKAVEHISELQNYYLEQDESDRSEEDVSRDEKEVKELIKKALDSGNAEILKYCSKNSFDIIFVTALLNEDFKTMIDSCKHIDFGEDFIGKYAFLTNYLYNTRHDYFEDQEVHQALVDLSKTIAIYIVENAKDYGAKGNINAKDWMDGASFINYLIDVVDYYKKSDYRGVEIFTAKLVANVIMKIMAYYPDKIFYGMTMLAEAFEHNEDFEDAINVYMGVYDDAQRLCREMDLDEIDDDDLKIARYLADTITILNRLNGFADDEMYALATRIINGESIGNSEKVVSEVIADDSSISVSGADESDDDEDDDEGEGIYDKMMRMKKLNEALQEQSEFVDDYCDEDPSEEINAKITAALDKMQALCVELSGEYSCYYSFAMALYQVAESYDASFSAAENHQNYFDFIYQHVDEDDASIFEWNYEEFQRLVKENSAKNSTY